MYTSSGKKIDCVLESNRTRGKDSTVCVTKKVINVSLMTLRLITALEMYTLEDNAKKKYEKKLLFFFSINFCKLCDR